MQRFATSAVTRSLLATALAVTALAGCTMKPKASPQPMAMPISADDLERMRAAFALSDPGAKVGSVSDVLPPTEGDKLRITGISVADFKVGTVVSIIDGQQNVLANARVYTTVDNAVDVDFQTIAGMRRPAIGDAAVKLSKP